MATLLTHDDLDLVVAFAGCSLDESPGSNWVQEAGGLPEYICEIARAIKRKGRSTSQAISIAVSRVKKWAAGIGVNADTQAKAAKALAEWEKLKAKSKAKKAAKKSEHTLAASRVDDDVLVLANVDYPVDIVSRAFEQRAREARTAWRQANPTASYDDAGYPPYMYVREQWTSFLIVSSDYGKNPTLWKVPYEVDNNLDVSFGDPVEVKTEYVEVDDTSDDLGGDISDEELQKLMGMSAPRRRSPIEKFLDFAPAPSPLERILALADSKKPYGDVEYADPGYQKDGQKRYPLDTEQHVRAAWSYINQEKNAELYSAEQLAKVKAKIKAAAKKLGIEISDD